MGFQGIGQFPGLLSLSKGCRRSERAVRSHEAEEKAQKGGVKDHIHKPALDKPHWHKTHHLDTSEYMFTLLCILHLESTEPRGDIHNS